MIHYTCDYCKRPLETEHELRYVVRMEVYAAMDESEDTPDLDADQLQDVEDMLEGLSEANDEEFEAAIYKQLRFDLCSECRERFMRDPIGRQISTHFDFSEN